MTRLLLAAALLTSCTASSQGGDVNAVTRDLSAKDGHDGDFHRLAVPASPPHRASRTRPTAVPTRQPVAPVSSRPFESGTAGSGLNWTALAQCESSGNPRAVSPNGKYFGAFQFDLRTWAQYGPPTRPTSEDYTEQLRRAKLLFAERGRQPWPVCGRLL